MLLCVLCGESPLVLRCDASKLLQRQKVEALWTARPIWVFDRGIVSEANLAALRRRGGQYLVGTPRLKLKGMERELLQSTWTQVREKVEAQLVPPVGRRRNICAVALEGAAQKGVGHPPPLLEPHGANPHASGATRGERAIERLVENRATTGEDSGTLCSGGRRVRSGPRFRLQISFPRPPAVGRLACGVLRPSVLNNNGR